MKPTKVLSPIKTAKLITTNPPVAIGYAAIPTTTGKCQDLTVVTAVVTAVVVSFTSTLHNSLAITQLQDLDGNRTDTITGQPDHSNGGEVDDSTLDERASVIDSNVHRTSFPCRHSYLRSKWEGLVSGRQLLGIKPLSRCRLVATRIHGRDAMFG